MAESKARGLLRDLVAGGRLEALPDGFSAQALAEAAGDQGVAGLLLLAIERDRPAWAGPVTEALVARRRALLVRTLGQVGLAARCLSLLEARGIRALPLKGVALAETVYDVESDRPMSDVDLLALERWPEAVLALREAGFVEVARGDHAWAFRAPGSREVVELHRSVVSAPGLFPPDPEGLWARSRPGRGQLGRLPSAEDLLLQLALHAAFQHGLSLSLVQWLDFRRVLEREEVDVARLLALAAARARRGPPRRRAPRGGGGGGRAGALLAAAAPARGPAALARSPPRPAAVASSPRPSPTSRARAGSCSRAGGPSSSGARSSRRRRRTATSVWPRGWRSPSAAPCASRAGGRASRPSPRPTTSASPRPRPRASRCPSARSCCGTASPPSPTSG